ncbi:MAG: DUF4384 domain-containing protein [Pseudomonadota bacterium]
MAFFVCLMAGAASAVSLRSAPDTPIALKAFGVFKTHCARCHQRAVPGLGRPQSASSREPRVSSSANTDSLSQTQGGIAQITDLDWLAKRRDLVVPGQPEASRLYQVMVARQMPYDVFHARSGGLEPTAFDLEAVRDWITSLEERAERVCGKDPRELGADMRAKAVSRWLAGPLLADGERERLAIVHLSGRDVCDSGTSRAANATQGLELIRTLPGFEGLTLTPLAVPGVRLAVGIVGDPDDGRAPPWHALEVPVGSEAERVLKALGLVVDGGPPVIDLAALGNAGIARERSHVLSRPEVSRGPVVTSARKAQEALLPQGLAITSRKTHFQKGDELVLDITTDRACRLTVINIEPSGRATVLFPNQFSPDNAMKAGETVTLPNPDGPFLLALDDVGQETFLAVCLMEDRASIPGVMHDFDIQPFTILGDWSSHIRRQLAADKRERSLVGKRLSRRKKRSLRRQGIVLRASAAPLKQMRAAIRLDVAD